MDYSKNPEMLQKKPHKSRNVIDIFFILPSPVQIRHPPETMVCKNEFGTIQRGCLYFVIFRGWDSVFIYLLRGPGSIMGLGFGSVVTSYMK